MLYANTFSGCLKVFYTNFKLNNFPLTPLPNSTKLTKLPQLHFFLIILLPFVEKMRYHRKRLNLYLFYVNTTISLRLFGN